MKILFATDGFEPATAAAALLERVADPARASITVMSVTPIGFPAPDRAVVMLDDLQARREQTLQLVDDVSARLRDAGFAVRGRTAEGRPAAEILAAVIEDWYDLTVIGSGHTTWLGQRLLGGVSRELIHHSPSSVLVAHPNGHSDHPPTVLLAADGSRGSEFAMRTVSNLCDPKRVRVIVTSVAQPPMIFALPGAVTVVEYPDQQLRQRLIDQASRQAERVAARLRRSGFEVTTTILEGTPIEQILKEADAVSADLVAVGARGLGPLKRALLGSVSDHITHHARAALVGRRRTDLEQT